MLSDYKLAFCSIAILLCISGCTTLGYYHQSISGHLSLISQRERIDDIVNDSERDEKLIEQLILAQELRTFASSVLKLPDNDSYRSYVQLDKPYVTWNVFAAPEFSISLQQWCFLIIGCVQYRGYFDEQDANRYASKLAKQGLDVYVAGVPAYSTLGWFDDPLLSSMIARGEIVTASYIFHELAHQLFYVKGDSAYNEAFATAVEEIGVKGWLQQHQRAEELEKYQQWLNQKTIFSDFVKQGRNEFEKLYAMDLTDEEMRTAKDEKIKQFRNTFSNLEKSHPLLSKYSKWMSGPLNNAQLGAISLYRELVPSFMHLFKVCEENFGNFYKKAEEISEVNIDKRISALQAVQSCP